MAFKVRSIKFNFLMNLLLTGSSLLFPLITFPIVSRALLADAYGLAGWAISVANWASLIAMLGVARYGIREVAAVRDDAARLAQVTREILLVTVISTLVVYACFVASLFLVEKFAVNRVLLLITSVTVLCNTLGVNWFFQGIEQYHYITIRGICVKAVCLIGVIALVHVPDDYLLYAALMVFSGALANLINFAYMRHFLKQADEEAALPSLPRLDLKKHVRPLFTFFVITAAISVYSGLDTVMLGFLSTDTQVGYYVADANVKTALAGIVSALTGVLLPRAANLLANGKSQEHKAVIRKCLLAVLGMSVPVCCILAVVATPVITWYAGTSFAGAGPALSVICVSVIFIGLSTIFCDAVMIPLGMERYCTWIYIAAAVIDFCANLVLIPLMGALGAALSTATVEVLIAVVEFLIVRKYLFGRD